MDRYYLAVDIGASSGRHILGHIRDGRMQLEEVYRFENGMINREGRLLWDTEQLFSEIINGMKRCAAVGKIPASMSVDTWAVDYVLLDGEDRVLGDTYGYRDARTQGMDERVYQAVSEEALYARTGIQKQPFNTIYQLMADRVQRPEILEKAKTFLMLPDYFQFLLTGNKVSEYTNGTSTQLVSPVTGQWDRELIRLLGYPEDIFLPLQMPGTEVGRMRESVAQEVGFDCQVVLCGSHDTASAVMAVPRSDGDALYISSGTWSLMGVELTEADCREESRRANFTNEGGYACRFRYLKNIMGLWMIQSIRHELGDRYSFAELCDMAEQAADFPSRVQANAPCFLAPSSMTEAVRDYCRDTGQQVPDTVGELASVIYRSLADCYRETAEEIEANTGKKYGSISIIGGGANAAYLNQLTADAAGKTVYAGPVEATAIGNIMAQMIRAGEFNDLTEARKCVAASSVIQEYRPQKRRRTMMTAERYASAKEMFAAVGVDTDAALEVLKGVPVSMHCWQGDDVIGFDHDGPLTGGIQTTGDYPGKARTPEELMADMDKAISMVPGKKKINVHACYAIFEEGEFADRNRLEPKHFARWVAFAKERGMGLDFNPTFFSHPMVKDGLTLSSPDEEVRRFWIEHGKACIRISQYFAEETGIPCVMNIWTGDGFKDVPADRMGPRMRYKTAIEEILAEPYDKDKVKPCVESKVFGIGVESYTAGSAEFTLSFAATHEGCLPLMDNGHYHPTEVVSDKIPAMLCFYPEIALHVTRGVRWDSDHVLLLDDETREIAKEIVRCDALERVYIALDYFDASINRISAWAVGMRSFQKALLMALCTPHEHLRKLQDESRFTELMAVQEALKMLPFGDVWNHYCEQCGVVGDFELFGEVQKYEDEILKKRS